MVLGACMKKNVARHLTYIPFFVLCVHSFLYADYITKYITHAAFSKKVFEPHTIIIWVHGTRFIKSREFKTVFQKTPQLKKSNDLMATRYYQKIAHTFTMHHALNKDNLYFFGWSGKLCNKERKKCAFYLYNEIITLKEHYEKKHNVSPTMLLIGHSHGGNVILHMASYHCPKKLFSIDKIVLLACPVQDAIYHALNSPLFKKIYSLYSYRDIIQILAPNFLKKKGLALKNIKANPFSKRIFPVQSNLIQSRIIVNGNGPRHNDFVKQPFLSLLPAILHNMETWNFHKDQRQYLTYLSANSS